MTPAIEKARDTALTAARALSEAMEKERTLTKDGGLFEMVTCVNLARAALEAATGDAVAKEGLRALMAAGLASAGGSSGRGKMKRRGDSAYYKRLARRGWRRERALSDRERFNEAERRLTAPQRHTIKYGLESDEGYADLIASPVRTGVTFVIRAYRDGGVWRRGLFANHPPELPDDSGRAGGKVYASSKRAWAGNPDRKAPPAPRKDLTPGTS